MTSLDQRATASDQRFDALTGLRFLAATGVVVHHVFRRYDLSSEWLHQLIERLGDGAVSLFFVLSGLVLAVSEARRGRDDTRSPRAFWVARVARIYPIYLFAALLALPAAYIGYSSEGIAPETFAPRLVAIVGLCAMLLQAWTPFTGTLNPPSWSLSVEALFYFVFPALAGLIWIERRRLVAVAVLGWLVASLCYALSCDARGPGRDIAGIPLLFFPPLRLAEFVVGIAAGAWLARSHRRSPDIRLKLAALASLGLWLAAAALVPDPYYRAAAVPVTVVLLLTLALAGDWRWSFGSRPLVVLGASSYALYLIHSPILTYFTLYGDDRMLSASIFPVYFVAVSLLSIALHYAVERPAASWVLTRFKGRGNASREADTAGRVSKRDYTP